ncbi:30S ribosomal protein S6 [Candidatus Saccharibacteria bacterium]|nr:30S ribosomal protein S6 [Candidatus Saccharibacteria bacterium]
MKDYELTVLFHPDLEMNLEPSLDKVKKIVEENGGKINKLTEDGKKRLAYKIGGQDFAVYCYMEVSLPAEAPAKISSVLNITDEVLRYLLVKVDERKLKMLAKKTNNGESKEEPEKEEE